MTSKKKSVTTDHVTLEEVKDFWQRNPLCVNGITYLAGTPQFFKEYDTQRESIESVPFSYALHEYRDFNKKKVLDVGSGNGYVLSKYAIEGAEVFGIDITQEGIDLCRKRFDNLNLQGHFQVADAQKLPFADNSFDCVCSMGVLHHVPDTQKALDEIYRVLKPGGRLIVMFYHRNSAKYQLKYRVWSCVTGKSMQQLVNEFDGIGNPKGTVFSKKQLNVMLARFTEVEMQVGFLETRDVILRGARYLPDDLFNLFAPFLGWNLYAKGRKPK